ncbi:unnamed protein product, partial [Musa acuminata var. zebrina]
GAPPQGAGGEFYVITWDSPRSKCSRCPPAALPSCGRAQPAEAGAQGTVPGARHPAAVQVQDQVPVLPGVPNGEVQYLHPKDGVYPEKVNPGRQGVGQNMRSIGKNVSPIEVKFTGKQVYDL